MDLESVSRRGARVPIAELESIETALGVSLPQEYRDFLLSVGSGDRPYYGLWSPAKAFSELRELAEEYEQDEGRRIHAAAPFPITSVDLDDIDTRLTAGAASVWIEREWPCDGCLPIGEQGCTLYFVLVLAGELRGTVFDCNHMIGYTAEWLPARRPAGIVKLGFNALELPRMPRPVTFRQWVEGWVERCQWDLGLLKQTT